MKSTDLPTKFPIPFGNNAATGTSRPIPQASQATITPGAASLYDGFPVITGQPLASGGIPPALQDFNGILNQISAWSRWQSAGGLTAYDSTFSTAVGGYPLGAALSSSTGGGRIWISTVDNNTTNPDTSGAANWLPLMLSSDVLTLLPQTPFTGTRGVAVLSSSQTWVVPTNVYFLKRVRLWGGGGGGGGSFGTSSGGSGGGGGGYAEKFNIAVTPGQQIAATIGGGGAGGSGSPTNGSAGGTTSLGAFFSATGGGGGYAGNGSIQNTQSGLFGNGSGGDFNVPGSNGGFAFSVGSNPGSGTGGAATFGGSIPSPNYGTAGNFGNFPGGAANGGSSGGAGGAGAPGLIIIEY